MESRTDYCLKLIWQAFCKKNSSKKFYMSPLKSKIVGKVALLNNKHNLTTEELYQEACISFLTNGIEYKINIIKGSPVTFILHYVNGWLSNKINKLKENMDMLNQSTVSMDELLYDLVDTDNPEDMMMVKESIEIIEKKYGMEYVKFILGSSDKTIQDFATEEGITYAAAQKKIWRVKDDWAHLLKN